MKVENQIVDRLLSDPHFAFKERGQYLQSGICPDCHKKELFISKTKPYVVKCNRLNQCSYEENTRDIYPDIFQRFSKLYPSTPDNPQATADAYMQYDRQFDIAKIKHWYSQESYRLPNSNEYVDTVRFYFDDERTRYWERLIDKAKVDGQRFNIRGKKKSFPKNHELHSDYNGSLYKGEWWKPEDLTIQKNDVVYLVEAIFHALGFYFSGHKTAATISAGNFPSLAIKPYLGMGITWVLALDDDKAGRTNMRKHAKELKMLGEKVAFALTGENKRDWDDLYRAGKLTDHFIDNCLYRGRLFGAKTVKEKAYHWYCKNNQVYTVLDFNNRFYSISIDGKLNDELGLAKSENVEIRDFLNTPEGNNIFRQYVKTTPITNCKPTFLYCEQHQITEELAYFFNVSFPSMADRKISLTGSALESPASFNKSLLNKAPGAGFDGCNSDFKTIKGQWFDKGILVVETIPFLGYDKKSKTYVFNDWAYRNGKPLKINNHGYFEAGKHQIKSTFKSIQIEKTGEKFNPDWLPDFEKVYSSQGVVGLAFFLGSLFAQQIRAELKSFPFFELTGEQSAGKSTLLELLWKLLGRDEHEGIDPGTITKSSRGRYFSQLSNMPIVLIEADGHEKEKAKVQAFDFEALKPSFNGRSVRTIASFNRGNDVEESPFMGSIVISQNDPVDGSPALLSRIVHCHCSKVHFTPETKKLAPRFEKATTTEFASFLPAVLEKETEILEHFFSKYEEIDKALTDKGTVREPRIIKTHSMIAALASSLRFIFPSYDDKRDARLRAYIFERAQSRQERMNVDHTVVQQFWEIYDLLNIGTGSSPGYAAHKPTLNHSSNQEVIAINLTHFGQVCSEARVETIPNKDLKKHLPGSKRFQFLCSKNVKSAIKEKAVWCMVFKNGGEV